MKLTYTQKGRAGDVYLFRDTDHDRPTYTCHGCSLNQGDTLKISALSLVGAAGKALKHMERHRDRGEQIDGVAITMLRLEATE